MRTWFGSVGLIAGAMASTLVCYTVSLRVAAERSEVERVRRAIVADMRDIRALEAELRTRARLPQLQRWNDEVLAMSAPTSKQFADSAVQLAAYAPDAAPASEPRAPEVQLAVASRPIVEAPVVRTVAYQPVQSAAEPKPVLVKASVMSPVKAATPRPAKPRSAVQVADAQAFGLSDSLMRQIDATADAERASFRKVSMQ